MSTKMGEYLWSGTPVIYYGPKGIAMTEFLESYQCATIITEPNLKLLIDSVYQSITNPNIAKINKGKEIAMEYFNKDKMTEALLYECGFTLFEDDTSNNKTNYYFREDKK